MSRPWVFLLPMWAVVAMACLDSNPDANYLARLDETPPALLRVEPQADGGLITASRDEPLQVVFSEPMELRSLRPGIVLVRKGEEQRLVVSVDPPPPARVNDPDNEFIVRVQAISPDGLSPVEAGGYVLVLRTLLTDEQGNALPEEIQFGVSLK